MEKIRLVCFDVDGTLVDGVSWLFLTSSLGCSTQEHINIFLKARNKEISFLEGERLLTKMYRNSGNATKSFIKNIFTEVKPKSEARKLISYLKGRKYLIYLISGAIDLYVGEIAKKLKVDGFYANSSLEFDEKGILKKIYYRDNQGDVKVEQLKQLIHKLGVKMSEVVFVGDSENDLEVFKETGHGIAVNPKSEDLIKVAWKIINSLEEIKGIL